MIHFIKETDGTLHTRDGWYPSYERQMTLIKETDDTLHTRDG